MEQPSKPIHDYRLEDPAGELQDLKVLLEGRATHFSDEEVPPSDLALDRTTPVITLIRQSKVAEVDELEDDDAAAAIQTHFKVEHHAVQLLCARLKVPYQYFARCMKGKGDDGLHLDAHLQHWMEKQAKTTKWFVRYDDYSGENQIRGILTNRYEVYDNCEAFELVCKYLPDHFNWRESFLWTPTLLYVDLRNMAMKRTICGKEIHAAIRMRNSEVGCGSLSCELLTVNSTDSSGIFMTGYTGFRRVHLQRKDDNFEEQFKKDLAAMVENMEGSLDDLEATQHVKVVEPDEVKATIFDSNRLDVGQQESINKFWINGSVKTLFDVIQAMAMAGTDPEISMERREGIQKAAGKMVYNTTRYGRWLQPTAP
jgi:hypothetical protein